MTFTEQDHMQECRVVTVNLINAVNDYRHLMDTDEFKLVSIRLVGGMVLADRHSSVENVFGSDVLSGCVLYLNKNDKGIISHELVHIQ